MKAPIIPHAWQKPRGSDTKVVVNIRDEQHPKITR